MKDKKKKQELTNEEIDENIFEMCNICSTTDCTGFLWPVMTVRSCFIFLNSFRIILLLFYQIYRKNKTTFLMQTIFKS